MTNSDVSDSAELAMSKITATASDATLADCFENFISGCDIYRVDSTNIGITTGSVMVDG